MNETLETVLNIAGFFGGAFIFSAVINAFLLKFAHSLGIRQKTQRQIRWAPEVKPSLGGVSFYFTFLFGFMFYAVIFGKSDVFQNQSLLGLFVSITLAFLLGLSDDAYDTRPRIKLLAQITCGAILILTDSGISLFPFEWLNYTMTIFWVVAIMNSINMLDNMDGITTIASISILLTIIGISIPFDMINNVHMFLMIIILGALGGFLVFNWHPAKMFMGDTGSQFLGMFLAYFSIKYLWNNGMEINDYSILSNLTLVVVAFALPIIDTTFVTIQRLRRGQKPWIGGKDHTTHTLFYKGMTEKQVALVFVILGIISSLLALNLAKYIPKDSISPVLMWVYVGSLLAFMFWLARGNEESKK